MTEPKTTQPDKENVEIWLVDVAVPVPVRRTFSYRIPTDTYAPQIVRKGHRVMVPFRSKLIHGVTFSDAYRAGPDSPDARYLVSFEREQRVLAEEIANLVDWVVKYYRAPVGEAVRMMLPPGVLNQREPRFSLTQTGREYAAEHEEARPLLLLEGQALTRTQWEARAQTTIPFGVIRDWEDMGLIAVKLQMKERESVPHVDAVMVSPAAIANCGELLKRAPKQSTILQWLREQPAGPVALSDVHQAFPNSSAILAQLVGRGLCRRIRIPKHMLGLAPDPLETKPIHRLTEEQSAALDQIKEALAKETYQSFLMFGVTGSGKTEVYLRAIKRCLQQGRQALFLVPEIALTPLMQGRIEDRFGERLAILHSAVGSGRRAEAWARAMAGKADVVLGARSGVFAPLPRLGLVIVDEEHDQSYKQNDGIRYHARDLALVRAKRAGAVVVLGSATPSLESWQNHLVGRHRLIRLSKRATNAPLPRVDIVDLRTEFQTQRRRVLLSTLMIEALNQTLSAGEQAMILLNRRGFHSFLMCRKCGETIMCSRCEVSLTYHSTDHRLKCHYCEETKVVPQACPACGSAATMLQFFGEGTQQVQQTVTQQFPGAIVDRLDRDRLTHRDAHQEILARFARGESQVLVGTQMIAKGHDFPNVTMVGILNADQGLHIPDFRSAENVFQLVTQVAGRSGRGERPGRVVIQTYMPEHYSIVAASGHDFPAFLKRELNFRRHLFYSPFSYMVNILVTHQEMDRAQQAGVWLAEQLKGLRGDSDLVVLGPTKAPIGRIKDKFRFQVLLKSASRNHLHNLVDAVVEEAVRRGFIPRSAVILDIDPYQFS